MRYIPPSFIVFSVFREEKSEQENERAHNNALAYLDYVNIPYQEVQGVWEGNTETGIVINGKHVAIVIEYAETYEQDAILYVDGDKIASLGTREHHYAPVDVLGQWTEVPRYQALKEQAHTKWNGKYYIVSEVRI